MTFNPPRAEWPSSDKVMWQTLWSDAGPLDDPGPLAHLRQTTHNSLEPRYARWIKWLRAHDVASLNLHPADRATVSRLQKWLATLEHTRPMTRLSYIDGVLRILVAAAPEMDWSLQRRLLDGLRRAAGRGDQSRKSGRVLSSAVLLQLGLNHAGPYSEAAATPLERKKRLRDGAMIALLAVLPMRRRSFCELALDRSVHVDGARILICLSEDMTKTAVSWETAVPHQVEPTLRRYIEDARPFLMSRGDQHHDILWVGKKGEIIGQNYIGSRIGKLTKRLTGKRVSPHLFRDAAATTMVRTSPQASRLIQPVLAHSSPRTAERHYIHAQTIDAGRDYASLIGKLKKDTR
ncbi:tyrosine-type recombinase/integrase [Flavimaricola marinus]|uniref:Site-specific tyrosine recombinase XerC n=1 Tax=Flavimaricola marinus TaxID=1819565 RepID=A0A238LNE3_9RHOB|nr:tyrosine-type recombinase/integrase [Flavimaricola marinus]SMY10406.1 site-specific tyrosine recombinase XerC [Flavimaricola marinus]